MNAKRTPWLLLYCLAAFLITGAVPAGACPDGIIRVKPGNPQTEDGCSWVTAFNTVQEAIAAAQAGDRIWVAAGTYVPGDDRGDSFAIPDGVRVYGGLAGDETPYAFDPPGVDNRDFVANESILSGDIGVPGVASDNSYCVVLISSGTLPRWLDGFTITGGYGGYGGSGDGAGLYIIEANPTIANWLLAVSCG